MTFKKCELTGLEFDPVEWGKSARTKIHPDISWWKTRSNKKMWYSRFFEAVEFCKEKGFATIEQFEDVFRRAEDRKPFEDPPAPEGFLLKLLNGTQEKGWAAKIEGWDSTYLYRQKFLLPHSKDGREKTFVLNEPGLYRARSYSRNDNPSNYFFSVFANGEVEELTEEQFNAQTIAAFGSNPYETEGVETIEVSFPNNQELFGDVLFISKNNKWYRVLSTAEEYEDEDGVIHSQYPTETYVMATYVKYFCVPTEKEEIQQIEAQQQARNKALSAGKQLRETWQNIRTLATEEQLQALQSPGLKISVRDKQLSYNSPILFLPKLPKYKRLVLALTYNGADGHNWSLSNWNDYICRAVEVLEPEFERLWKLAETFANFYPDTVEAKK